MVLSRSPQETQNVQRKSLALPSRLNTQWVLGRQGMADAKTPPSTLHTRSQTPTALFASAVVPCFNASLAMIADRAMSAAPSRNGLPGKRTFTSGRVK